MAAAFRRISKQFTGEFGRSNPNYLSPPALLISRRGIVSRLFVGGLSYNTSEKSLSEAFSQYGQVVEAKIVTDKVSDRSRGFGFVTFASGDEADNAVSEMNGKTLNGRTIFVEYAKLTFRSDDLGAPIARGPPDTTAVKETD